MTRQKKELAHMDSLRSDAVPATAGKNELTHAPGPWTVIECAGLHEWMVESTEWVVAEMCGERERALANAHLIAAAPDLLAALKAIVEVLRVEAQGTPLNNRKYDHIGIQAHAAIAKAESR
jgi:hypothetical protein